ncbi:MAG: kinase [Clostridia bacterium]|nr:kinase [Clostridia bacterium]
MLIVRTPFRMSFFGGGTDFTEYFSAYGGSVLSTTIDKYCYLTLRHMPPFFEYQSQLTYSQIERFNAPEELQHPLVREALQYLPTERIQISYDADLPACSGIGSSSAFAVGLLQGLHALRGEYPDRMTLAKEAIYLERERCGEAGGVQDQLAAAFGGFNRLNFTADGYEVLPIQISKARADAFQNQLLLLFTGFTHVSGIVAREQKQNIPATLAQLNEMKALADIAQEILINGDMDEFGRLLDHTWRLKRTLSSRITNDAIDAIYLKAKACGALGGKLLGAGGGGFMLLYVPQEKREHLLSRMQAYKFVPFAFENTGTQILYRNDTM